MLYNQNKDLLYGNILKEMHEMSSAKEQKEEVIFGDVGGGGN